MTDGTRDSGSVADAKPRQRSGSLADFFAASPLRDSGVVIERVDIPARDVELAPELTPDQ